MRLQDCSGRQVAVWGAGVEGSAAVGLLLQHGAPASVVVVVDNSRPTDPTSINGVPVIDLTSQPFPAEVDLIMKSPGISPYHGGLHDLIVARQTSGNPIDVFGGTALWFSEAASAATQPLRRTIAVTGSKGKSTTSSLIAHLLSGLTDDVLLAGNVGRAPLDVLRAGLATGDPFPASRWHVLELSSFQTSEVSHSPGVGVLTSLFEEHLDWHETVERYFADKVNLFMHPQPGGIDVVANVAVPDVERWLGTAAVAHKDIRIVPYGDDRGFQVAVDGTIVEGSRTYAGAASVPLLGRHNAANICGALTALRCAGWEPWDHHDVLVGLLATFQPLEHRLQPVGTIDGRDVVDDSLSTAPQAAIAALAAFDGRPVGIIIGGHDRGLNYQPLADAIATRRSPTWIVGVPQSGLRIGELIARTCANSGSTNATVVQVDDFDDAVPALLALVPAGGVLLLSPAAPSFGRFTDYRERGMRFRSLLGL